MRLNKKSKIFIAGHKGMVGSAILNYLKKKGYKNLITESKSKLNLLSQKDTQNFISRINPDFIVIAAAKGVGCAVYNFCSQVFPIHGERPAGGLCISFNFGCLKVYYRTAIKIIGKRC